MLIYVGKNKTECLIDEEDYEKLNKKGNFFCNTEQGYICVKNYISFKNGKAKYKQQYLHRMIMDAPTSLQVDHINGNKKDNRKENLRLCTNAGNSKNKKNFKGKYKGVYFDKKNSKWMAQITKDYHCFYIGSFLNENEAAIAYNDRAKELHGEFAYLNIIS